MGRLTSAGIIVDIPCAVLVDRNIGVDLIGLTQPLVEVGARTVRMRRPLLGLGLQGGGIGRARIGLGLSQPSLGVDLGGIGLTALHLNPVGLGALTNLKGLLSLALDPALTL